jgi:hypothetical protein
MAGKWETHIGQLRLVGGSRQENPANLGVAERRSFLPISARGKGRLFVLIELSGGAFGREELCQDLVTAVIEEYFHTPGTVTYGLRQAILLANTHLLRVNAQVSSEHRAGGISCVVLRGGEIFVAQAGWPMAYVIHRERVQAFPDTTLVDEDSSMLGQRQTTEVRFFRSPIRSGDMILMADGPMARQLGITRIGQIVSGGVEHAMSNLNTLAPPEDCTAMVIQIGSPNARAGAQTEQWAFMPVETPEDLEPLSESMPAPTAPPLEEDIYPVHVEEADETFETLPQEPASTSDVTKDTGPTVNERARMAFKAMGQGMRTLGERLLPDKSPQRSSTQRRRRATRARRSRGQAVGRPNWGIVFAIAIPILALILVGGYTMYRDWSLQSQFKTQLEAAKQKRDVAVGSEESPTVARDYWLEVIALANDADSLQGNHPEVAQLRAQAEAAIDRIDGVIRLGTVYKLYDYAAIGSAPSRIIVAGLDVYVLDRGAGLVYHHALNELRNALRNPNAEQILIQEGQPVEGQNVGDLVDIAWMKEGGERQAGELLILDRNGLLLQFDPSWEQLRVQLVGGQDMWRSLLVLSTFDSNLYLLDTMASQIFKYANQQYAGTPTRWIQQDDADLSTAIDIGIDGNIYVLHSNGKLEKYYGGELASFAVTRIPKPMAKADALYLDTEDVAQYMYVADRTEKRIVQLDREGVFVRQLKPALGQEEAFRQLATIFVDETGGKLYYVAANALYVTDIPPVQR